MKFVLLVFAVATTANAADAAADPTFGAATQAIGQITGFMKDQLTGFLDDVKQTASGVKSWEEKYQDYSVKNLPEYTAKVAVASTQLANAHSDGKNVMTSLESLLAMTVPQLETAFAATGPGAEAKVAKAVEMAKLALSIALKSADEKLVVLIASLTKAQLTLAGVAAMSETTANLIDNSIKGETDWVKNKIAQWRAEAYGTCGGLTVITLGLAAAPCFATAAAIVETKINGLNSHLNDQKAAVENLKKMFLKNEANAKALLVTATDERTKLSTVESAVSDAVPIVEGSDLAEWWKMFSLPTLKNLVKTLQDTLAGWDSKAAARRLDLADDLTDVVAKAAHELGEAEKEVADLIAEAHEVYTTSFAMHGGSGRIAVDQNSAMGPLDNAALDRMHAAWDRARDASELSKKDDADKSDIEKATGLKVGPLIAICAGSVLGALFVGVAIGRKTKPQPQADSAAVRAKAVEGGDQVGYITSV